jgi:hypothetical protein
LAWRKIRVGRGTARLVCVVYEALGSETNEFHKRLSTPGMPPRSTRNEEPPSYGTTHRGLTSDALQGSG